MPDPGVGPKRNSKQDQEGDHTDGNGGQDEQPRLTEEEIEAEENLEEDGSGSDCGSDDSRITGAAEVRSRSVLDSSCYAPLVFSSSL